MPPKATTPDIFDQWASTAPVADADAGGAQSAASVADHNAPPATPITPTTPVALRRAVQELLKNGVLEQAAKPHLFRQIASDTARVNAQLEPLDLQVRVDDVRGHGVVSEVDAQESITLRPMIVHLANPQNLQALLQHLRALAPQSGTGADTLQEP